MAVDPREGVVEYSQFKGLRNNVKAEEFERGDLVTALNVDVDDVGAIHRRRGYSTAVVAGSGHSLFAFGSTCLAVINNALVRILPDWSTVTLQASITANRAMRYAGVGDRVFYTNGIESGCVQTGVRRSWGLTPPALGAVTLQGGALRAGRYQWTMTYLRSDGQESGAPLAQVVTLTVAGGFVLTLPVSTDATVTEKAVYLTHTDGKTLYLYAIVDNADTTLTVLEERPGEIPLQTQFLEPPTALGELSHISYGNGRMLVAVDNRLFPSEPYAPELFDRRKSYPFADRITLVAFLEGGAWVGTDTQIVWLPNADIEQWDFKARADYGVIPGTATIASSEGVGDGRSKLPAVFFASNEGLCVGLADGQLINFTRGRFAYPKQPDGAGVVRNYRGGIQYLTTLRGVETSGNTAS